MLGALILCRLQVQTLGAVAQLQQFSALGWALVVGAIAVIAAAAFEFRRHETTILPHQWPTSIITSGVFAVTRNPIYVADALVIAGLGLIWGAWLAVVLVPLFIIAITRRFILPEEQKLFARFPEEFARYRAKTPRWLWGGKVPVGKADAGNY